MSNRFASRLAAAIGLLGAAVLPALAHHSTVMFAKDQEVKLTGTVTPVGDGVLVAVRR